MLLLADILSDQQHLELLDQLINLCIVDCNVDVCLPVVFGQGGEKQFCVEMLSH